ncbi:MAG: aminotransferase class IV [Alphaproteobacteria bacterium]|nr:aminotransferase class IV [Alphaproteobacteria bacterium]OJV15283.1 MAG: hypothetical protein BGO27_02105 [Alphaproteobacteria bacterium 33-17]
MTSKYGKMWVDGAITDSNDANIPIMTHGLHYASSVFEGIRVYYNKIFMLDEHIDRLFLSANLIGMTIPFSKDQIKNATLEVVAKNDIYFGYIRPVVFRGSEEIKIAAPNTTVHVAIAVWNTNTIEVPKDLSKGYKLNIGDYKRPSKECLPVQSKCAASYAIATLEKHKALAKGFDDSLLLDFEGNVAETTSSNIFFVKDNKLYTPLADCFLNGLTRQKIIFIAKQLEINVIETKINPNNIYEFEDCFVTSTTLDIMPVSSINKIIFNRHNITKRIYNKFYEDCILAYKSS